jgi:hypothetical protein
VSIHTVPHRLHTMPPDTPTVIAAHRCTLARARRQHALGVLFVRVGWLAILAAVMLAASLLIWP